LREVEGVHALVPEIEVSERDENGLRPEDDLNSGSGGVVRHEPERRDCRRRVADELDSSLAAEAHDLHDTLLGRLKSAMRTTRSATSARHTYLSSMADRPLDLADHREPVLLATS